MTIFVFIFAYIKTKLDIAIFVSIFVFVISPFLFYFKMFYSIEFTDDFQKIDKSKVIYSGLASHFKDSITVGGILYLFKDKFVFQTNSLNFMKRHELTIPINKHNDSIIEFSGNHLILSDINCMTETFIINNRKIWEEKIARRKV
jgi:hypothetical protein